MSKPFFNTFLFNVLLWIACISAFIYKEQFALWVVVVIFLTETVAFTWLCLRQYTIDSFSGVPSKFQNKGHAYSTNIAFVLMTVVSYVGFVLLSLETQQSLPWIIAGYFCAGFMLLTSSYIFYEEVYTASLDSKKRWNLHLERNM